MTTGAVWTWTVPEGTSERADKRIAEALESGAGMWAGERATCSRSRVQKLIDEGQVRVNQEPCAPKRRLQAGDQVEVRIPPPRPVKVQAEDRALEILFQDEHLLVVNKPPGLTVHPSSTQADGTLVNALLHHVRDLSGIGGELRPGIVHRIDKDTSGALVITKTDLAHQKLADLFSRHEIERAYWAICYGTPKDLHQTVRGQIGRSPTDRKRMAIVKSGGRDSVTHLKRLEAYGPRAKPYASLIEATLETGRTHQVRVHLTAMGHSLLGDPVYGTPSSQHGKWLALPDAVRAAVERLPGQALHARTLGFDHPVTGKRMRFEAEPPPAFAALLATLRQHRADGAAN